MIASMIAILCIIGFISLVIAFYESSNLWTAISFLCWLIIFASSMGVETYWIDYTQNITTTVHQDFGLQAFSFGMLFITVIMFLAQFFQNAENRRFRI